VVVRCPPDPLEPHAVNPTLATITNATGAASRNGLLLITACNRVICSARQYHRPK
jgi:hypothetical protein